MSLTKEQLAELKDLYSPESGWAGVREMAKYFNVGKYIIRYAVNYKDYKKKQYESSIKWRKNNPERWKKIEKKAAKKYCQTEKGKIKNREKYLKYYQRLKNDPIKYQKYLERCRQYHKNKKSKEKRN